MKAFVRNLSSSRKDKQDFRNLARPDVNLGQRYLLHHDDKKLQQQKSENTYVRKHLAFELELFNRHDDVVLIWHSADLAKNLVDDLKKTSYLTRSRKSVKNNIPH